MSDVDSDKGAAVAIESLTPIGGDKIETEKSGTQNETQIAQETKSEDEEPLTEEIIEWRAKMETMESPNAIRRWYFKLGKTLDQLYDGSEVPTKPHIVSSKLTWFSQILFDGIKLGYYEIVICISLKDINLDNPVESETLLEKEEILALHHLIFGSGKPDQIISAGANNPIPSDKPVAIVSYDLSYDGNYATTFYYSDNTDTLGHLDVWDLRTPKSNNPSDQTQVFNIPFAQTTFEVLETQEITIDISSRGHVAINGGRDSGMPFRVYKSVAVAPADKDISLPWSLQRAETICDGGYYLLTSYYMCNPDDTSEEGERFVTSNGRNFNVYNILGKWTQIYSISMQSDIDFRGAMAFYTSIQGGYFAWVTAVGVVSVWDFGTGQLISQIYIGSDSNVGAPCISRDGSLIAIPVKDTIQIRDTFTGIKLSVFRKGLDDNSQLELVFGKNHLLTYDSAKSTCERLGSYNARSVINVHDMSTVKTFDIHHDYHVEYPQYSDNPVFTYQHGPNVNIIKPGPILLPTPEISCGVDGVCERNPIEVLTLYVGSDYPVESTAGSKFIITTEAPFKRDEFIKEITVEVNDGQAEKSRLMTIPLGSVDNEYFGVFIPGSSQLAIITDDYLQLWNLSATTNRVCELALIWRLQVYPEGPNTRNYCIDKILSAAACEHGKNISINLAVSTWFMGEGDFMDSVSAADVKERTDTVTIPISEDDTIGKSEEDAARTTEEDRVLQGHLGLISLYTYGDNDCRKSILNYMKSNIRPTLKKPASCLVALCRVWNVDARAEIENIFTELLPKNYITWIPEAPLNKETDPLALILEVARTRPTAITVAKIIMSYCVNRATRSRNLAFLAPLFGSLHEVMELIPDEAFECLGRIAFIPVMHRSYIVENRIIVHPPRFRLKFWESINKPLYLMKDPIMQLDVNSNAPDPSNDKFTRPVFMASFDALWYYTDLVTSDGKKHKHETDKVTIAGTKTTSWWRTLYHMIRLKCHLRIHNYVECYDFDIEFFDNPAIAALVAYKWNTIGFTYWLVRFIFQCCFYALVTIAALMQVYYRDHSSQLVGLFIAIIVMAAMFLWLELLQAIRSVHRYTKSGYNFLDMVAFLLPLAASVDQLAMIYQKNSSGNTRLVSYSVLAVFLHMLFELRINKGVCKYVTIIQQAVIEIRVFFFILAGGIFAFTIATLHLFWACPYETCEEPTTSYPKHFIGAISATYFFM
ncbi:hypothetical protein BGX27_010470, partial [Mortierella sp. AM989]